MTRVLPQERRAHAEADAERGQAVAHVGAPAELVGELCHQPHAGGGERMAAGDRAPVRVESRIVGRDADTVAPRENLDGEGLVQLEEADVVDRQPGLREDALRGGHGPDAHEMRLDPGVGKPDEAHRRLEPELRGHGLGGEEARGGAVGEPRGVAGGDSAARAERGAECGEALERRLGSQELVARGDPPPLLAEDAHRHDGARHHAVLLGPGPGRPDLALERVAVGRLPRQMGEGVVEILGRLAHHGSALVDQSLAHEARVEVDLVAHRVVPHVLDAADEHEIGGAHRDLAGAGRRRRQRSRAHAVDREAGNGVGEAREQGDVPAERQALIADLRRRGEDHIADALDRHGRVAAEQLTDDLDRHVVGPRLPEETARPCLAERGADAVDEDDLVALAPHASEDSPFPPDSRGVLCDDGARRPAGGAGLLLGFSDGRAYR